MGQMKACRVKHLRYHDYSVTSVHGDIYHINEARSLIVKTT